jgi:hypothetical protein
MLTPYEVDLLGVIQPVEHFFDQERMRRPIRLDQIEMRERIGDVTSELCESSERQRRTVKAGFGLELDARNLPSH